MHSVSWHIYHAAGIPPMEGDEAGRCRLCGIEGQGVPFARWVKDTFTDYDKLCEGAIVCHACQFCASDAAPGLAARVGKDKPQKFRNYSHFVLNGTWHPLSKGDKRAMRDLLLQSPEVALVALSGQKHLFFRSLPGWWQVEETRARPFPDELARVLALVEPLYHGGISKAEIETGRYLPPRILSFGIERWRAIDNQIVSLRGSLPLQLALFLAQKGDEDDA